MNLKIIVLMVFLLIQSGLGGDPVLNQYIKTALDNNLALKQQEFSLRKSMAALAEARGMFLPSISINARYSRAGGGRIIEFPVGEFLNPVYRTLNQILQQPAFPEDIPDQIIPFLREREHETKISLYQPVFQPEIYYNYKINAKLAGIEEVKRTIFARRLVADVKEAYYTFLKTTRILDILNRTEDLLEENLRVSRSLFENDKSTKDVVYRAISDLSTLQQEKANAEKNIDLARAYFNFLLNRPLEDNIELIQLSEVMPTIEFTIPDAENMALKDREEINQLNLAVEAADNSVKLSKSAFSPNLILAAEYGFQGEEYRFTSDDDFWMASAVLRWNLFNGFRDRAKIQKSKLEQKKLLTQKSELEKQIQMEVREAYYNLIVSQKSLQSAQDRLTSASQSFEIVDEKYQLGLIPQIEYLDTRNNMIEAEINKAITTYDWYINQALFERVTAQYEIKF